MGLGFEKRALAKPSAFDCDFSRQRNTLLKLHGWCLELWHLPRPLSQAPSRREQVKGKFVLHAPYLALSSLFVVRRISSFGHHFRAHFLGLGVRPTGDIAAR